MTDLYPKRVLSRVVAFLGAAGVTAVLLAMQAGLLRGAVVAAIYLAALFSPFALIDALLLPSPRSRAARLARIVLLFVLILGLSAALQWRALAAVPADLQMQIMTEVLMRDFVFLGAYLSLEALLAALMHRRVPA